MLGQSVSVVETVKAEIELDVSAVRAGLNRMSVQKDASSPLLHCFLCHVSESMICATFRGLASLALSHPDLPHHKLSLMGEIGLIRASLHVGDAD